MQRTSPPLMQHPAEEAERPEPTSTRSSPPSSISLEVTEASQTTTTASLTDESGASSSEVALPSQARAPAMTERASDPMRVSLPDDCPARDPGAARFRFPLRVCHSLRLLGVTSHATVAWDPSGQSQEEFLREGAQCIRGRFGQPKATYIIEVRS